MQIKVDVEREDWYRVGKKNVGFLIRPLRNNELLKSV